MKLILQAIKALFRKIEASRTHWEEVEKVDIITETTVTILDDGGSKRLSETTQLTIGQTYFVILDGVSYKCVAWYSDDGSAVMIGNGAIFGGEGGNGEPFSCDNYSDGKIYLNTEKAGTYTISISTMENVVHKLDKNYLPDEVIKSIGIANNAQTTANSKMNASNPVGTGSFSMGRKANSEIGNNSHAEGNNTTASGNNSHAEGNNTTASGNGSHAEGYYTLAYRLYSHAEGYYTRAYGAYQHVQGKYNISDSQNKYAHIVGNGISFSASSNAHTLDWEGVPWFKGRPQFGGTAQDKNSQTVIANGDKEIILTSSTAGSTKKFKITVDDSGTLSATEIT